MSSERAAQFRLFAFLVECHIEKYTVPQYGDKPNDIVENFTQEDINTQIKKYTGRINSNARGERDSLRDCLKMAHYACLLHSLKVKAMIEREEKEEEKKVQQKLTKIINNTV
ncbi:MAG: hypothetical protein ACTSQA_00640 [Candidatus Heimdallarchaeaceae archaeon]